jgi:hypothetical protein
MVSVAGAIRFLSWPAAEIAVAQLEAALTRVRLRELLYLPKAGRGLAAD